jgi:hypothetical protein
VNSGFVLAALNGKSACWALKCRMRQSAKDRRGGKAIEGIKMAALPAGHADTPAGRCDSKLSPGLCHL